MILTWFPIDNDGDSAGSPFVIASGRARGPGTKVVLEHTVQHQRLTETVTYPRAQAAESFDRGNQITIFSALVACEFASFRECSQFCMNLGGNLSGRGNLRVAYEDGGEHIILRAVWQSIPTPSKIGSSVVIPDTFIGGSID